MELEDYDHDGPAVRYWFGADREIGVVIDPDEDGPAVLDVEGYPVAECDWHALPGGRHAVREAIQAAQDTHTGNGWAVREIGGPAWETGLSLPEARAEAARARRIAPGRWVVCR